MPGCSVSCTKSIRPASVAVFLGVLLAYAGAAFAHHATTEEFDARRRFTLTGTVTRVAWTNPHTFFYVDAKDPNTGRVANWACELGSPNMLAALGWTATTLKIGMAVTFSAIPARDGRHTVIPRGIVANGMKIVAWPSERKEE